MARAGAGGAKQGQRGPCCGWSGRAVAASSCQRDRRCRVGGFMGDHGQQRRTDRATDIGPAGFEESKDSGGVQWGSSATARVGSLPACPLCSAVQCGAPHWTWGGGWEPEPPALACSTRGLRLLAAGLRR